MKYARELIDLMGAYPGRKFRIGELVNYVAPPHASIRKRQTVRKGVSRVLAAMQESGSITVERDKPLGWCTYAKR
jgi:hypothetical protein